MLLWSQDELGRDKLRAMSCCSAEPQLQAIRVFIADGRSAARALIQCHICIFLNCSRKWADNSSRRISLENRPYLLTNRPRLILSACFVGVGALYLNMHYWTLWIAAEESDVIALDVNHGVDFNYEEITAAMWTPDDF